jgi:hypothetical protein
METLLLIVAFWLILLGVYGAIFLPRQTLGMDKVRPSVVVPLRAPAPSLRRMPSTRLVPTNVGSVSEVDMLRAQVDQLRSEILALSSAPARERTTTHRVPSTTAHLPRPLRRQVRELRTARRPLRVLN